MDNQYKDPVPKPTNPELTDPPYQYPPSSSNPQPPVHSRSNSKSQSRSVSSHSNHSASFSHSPYRANDPQERQNSSEPQRNPEAKPPQLDFLIFILKQLQPVLTEQKILNKIEAEVGDVTMEFDSSYVIPEYNGCLLKIKGNNLKKKRDATQLLLEFIVKNDLGLPENNSKKYEK